MGTGQAAAVQIDWGLTAAWIVLILLLAAWATAGVSAFLRMRAERRETAQELGEVLQEYRHLW